MKLMNEVATKEQDVIFPPTISNREYSIVIAVVVCLSEIGIVSILMKRWIDLNSFNNQDFT